MQTLKDMPIWVVWKYEFNKGKKTKVLYSAKTKYRFNYHAIGQEAQQPHQYLMIFLIHLLVETMRRRNSYYSLWEFAFRM